jgi:hypothetical protein
MLKCKLIKLFKESREENLKEPGLGEELHIRYQKHDP